MNYIAKKGRSCTQYDTFTHYNNIIMYKYKITLKLNNISYISRIFVLVVPREAPPLLAEIFSRSLNIFIRFKVVRELLKFFVLPLAKLFVVFLETETKM